MTDPKHPEDTMQLGHSADEIKYSHTVGTVARYVVILDGQPTMNIFCDSANPEKVIEIAPAKGATNGLQSTNGRFTMTEKFLESPDGEPVGVEQRVDEKSVYAYVLPRLHVLLGRLLRGDAA